MHYRNAVELVIIQTQNKQTKTDLRRGIEEIAISHSVWMIRLKHDAVQRRITFQIFQRHISLELIQKSYHCLDVTVLGCQVQWRHLTAVTEARNLHVYVARISSAKDLADIRRVQLAERMEHMSHSHTVEKSYMG